MEKPIRRVLWAANVRRKSLADRLIAAERGRFTHMSVFPVDYATWRAQGMTATEMRKRLHDSGIKVLAIDPFVQWVPDFRIPVGVPASYLDFISFSADEVLRMAEDLEAEAINCVEGLGVPHAPTALAGALGAFSEQASVRGLRLTLEFMPISSIVTLSDAWSILRHLDRAAVGLCLDTWHFFRSGSDASLLRDIPGDRVFEVQLADGLNVLEGATLSEDLLEFRRLPGEGELPIRQLVETLREAGAFTSVGPEVFARRMDALDAIEVGRLCGESTDRWTARTAAV